MAIEPRDIEQIYDLLDQYFSEDYGSEKVYLVGAIVSLETQLSRIADALEDLAERSEEQRGGVFGKSKG